MTSTHYFSIEPAEFRELAHGRQHAICVAKDAAVVVGDQLVLRECRPSATRSGRVAYTGAWLMRRATSMLEGYGIAPSHAVFSLNTGAENERAVVVMKRLLGLSEQQGMPADRFFRHQARKEEARRGVLRKNSETVARVRAASAGEPREGAASASEPREQVG